MRNGKCILFADLLISQIVFYAIIDNPEKTCYNYLCWCAESTLSGCGAVGSVLPWGGRGRPFKSGHSDQNQHAVSKIFRNCVFCCTMKTPSLTGGSKSLKLWVEKNNLQSYNKVKVCQPNNKKQRRYRHEKRRYK